MLITVDIKFLEQAEAFNIAILTYRQKLYSKQQFLITPLYIYCHVCHSKSVFMTRDTHSFRGTIATMANPNPNLNPNSNSNHNCKRFTDYRLWKWNCNPNNNYSGGPGAQFPLCNVRETYWVNVLSYNIFCRFYLLTSQRLISAQDHLYLSLALTPLLW